MKFSAYFPLLDFTEEVEIENKPIEAPEASELAKKIAAAKRTARTVNANDILERLEQLETQLENEKGSADGKMKILDGLRKELLQLDKLEKAQEWPAIEQELKNAFFSLEDLIKTIKVQGLGNNLNMSNVDNLLSEIKQKVNVAISSKNRGEAKELTQEIYGLDFNLRNEATGGAMDVQYLHHCNQKFNQFHWKNPTKARQLINQGLQQLANGNKNIRPILVELVQLIPQDELPTDTLG
jgi:molecular chaperone DnaK